MAAPSFISVYRDCITIHSTQTPKPLRQFHFETGDISCCDWTGGICQRRGQLDLRLAILGAILGHRQEEFSTSEGEGQLGYATTIWTATAADTTSITVTFTRDSTTANFFGGEVHVWRNSSGVGNSEVANNGTCSGAPSVNITTTQANSGLSVGCCRSECRCRHVYIYQHSRGGHRAHRFCGWCQLRGAHRHLCRCRCDRLQDRRHVGPRYAAVRHRSCGDKGVGGRGGGGGGATYAQHRLQSAHDCNVEWDCDMAALTDPRAARH